MIHQPKKADRLFGSPRFIGLTRNTGLRQPERFEPTHKQPGDIIICTTRVA